MRLPILKKQVLAVIASICVILFGQVNWQKPSWLRLILGNYCKSRRGRIQYGILIFVLIVLAVFVAWYTHLTASLRITAQITQTEIAAPAEQEIMRPLTLTFGYNKSEGNNAPYFRSEPVAPLAAINQKISQGISIKPAIQGTWLWTDDHSLRFTPETAWLPGQQYTINFAKNVFTENKKFASYEYEFTTPTFNVNIHDLKFYQDPIKPTDKAIIATLVFNYPVDLDSLKKNIRIIPQQMNGKNDLDLNAKSLGFSVKMAMHDRVAYIRSDNLTLPEKPSYFYVVAMPQLSAATNDATLNTMVKDKVLIPDCHSILKINQITAQIVRDPNNKPEQVLTVESSLGIAPNELASNIQVYLLPQDAPASKFRALQKNYQWSSVGEVTPSILAQSQPVTLTAIPSESDLPTLLSFKFNAPTNRYLYIHINNNFRSDGDYQLNQPHDSIVAVPAYPHEIRFVYAGSLLALNSEHKISIALRGIPQARFEMARVLPNEINHLITQTEGNYANPNFLNYQFGKNDIAEIFQYSQAFNSVDPAVEQYTAIDLDKYLNPDNNNKKPLGLFLLKAQGLNDKKEPLGAEATRLVLVTDMGLVVKHNADDSREMFVMSIAQGVPVANAHIDVLGRNGISIFSTQTDATGRAHLPSFKNAVNDHEPVVYLVTNNDDVSFMPFATRDRGLNFTRFDIGGISKNASQNDLSAYLFSDRGVYRPGEEMQLGIILKQGYAENAPAAIPLEEIITDPSGDVLLDQRFQSDPTGYLTLNYKIDPLAATGSYNVALYTIKDNKSNDLIGETNVFVKDFLPDTLKINVAFSNANTEGWVNPQHLGANITLTNLYGTPATDQRITGRLVLEPLPLNFKQFPHYHFNNPLYDPKNPPKRVTLDLTEQKTDANGKANFNFDLSRFDNATYQLTFYASGFAKDSGRAVNAQQTVTVSPLSSLIGYKTDGDFDFIRQNDKRAVTLVAINNQLKNIAQTSLKISLVQVMNVATLIKNDNGTYEYKTISKEQPVYTKPLALPARTFNYPLATDTVGQFVLIISDNHNTVLSRIPYSVVGNSATNLQKNAELAVSLDRKEYNPSDFIKLQITAPYTGSGLITLERDRVYAYSWFHAATTNSVQTIQIPKDFIGNGYLNVTYVRDLNANEIFMSPLSYSVTPFTVNKTAHSVNIKLSVPSDAPAGHNFPITYSSDVPAKIIVFAVDEGILQVADYDTPDPLSYFFRKRALEVETTQIVDQILPKFIADRALSASGGDGMARKLLNQYLNPFKRKADKPVAFWSGIISADSTPRTLEYPVPETFNGTLRIMAVAVAPDAVGATMQKALVRNPLIMSSNIPTVVAPGDTFQVAVTVTNNIKQANKAVPVTVALKNSEQFSILGQNTETLNLEPKAAQTALFSVHANDKLGNAELDITAKSADGNYISHTTETLSVRPAIVLQTTFNSGYSLDKAQELPLSRHLRPEMREQTFIVSQDPMIIMTGLARYLALYPYGCTEQLVSKIWAQFLLHNQLANASSADEASTHLEDLLANLRNRQNSDGSFAYWPGIANEAANRFASIYAIHLLTDMNDAGNTTAHDLLLNSLPYLKQISAETPTDLNSARLQAYAIYLLTRNEIVTTNYLTNLQLYLQEHFADKWQHDLTSSYLASSYALMQNNKEADYLITGFTPKNSKSDPSAWDDFWDQQTSTAQYDYLLAKHFPNLAKKLNTSIPINLVNDLTEYGTDTTVAAFDLLALSAYQHLATSSFSDNLSVTTTENNDKETRLSAVNQIATLPGDINKITIINKTNGGYFYQLLQSGFSTTLPTKAEAHGLEVERIYLDKQGNATDKIKLGEEVTVRIRIRSTDNQYYRHVALVDLLPGGFEIIQTDKKSEDAYYAEAHEDRMLYFLGVGPEMREITYQIRPDAKGTFTMPPIFAENMYNQRISAMGVAGKISVE